MNKRLLSYILILVMVFGSTAPCYAEAWTAQEAMQVTNDVLSIKTMFTNFFTTYNVNGGNVRFTFNDLASDVHQILHFVSPSFSSDTGLTLWDYLFLIGSEVNSLWSQWTSNFAQLNTLPSISSNLVSGNLDYLRYIRMGAGYTNVNDNDTNGIITLQHTMHMDLNTDTSDGGRQWGVYPIYDIGANGVMSIRKVQWPRGTGIGNLALILQQINSNQAEQYVNRWSADLAGYNATLGIWDSQQDSLTQETWVPQSAINGLYKYLAYLQRDVARMTFVLSSPEEQAAMENANESGVSAMYGDLYDDSNGGVTLSDMSDTFNTGKVAKQTFNSGVSFSTNGLFSFTDDEGWGFWSQAVMNDMDNVPQTRDNRMLKSSIQEPEYDMSAYEDRLGELLKIYNQEVVVDD